MWSLGPGFQLMMINNNNDMVLKVSWGLCYHVQSSSREETGLVSQLFLTRLESLLSRILGLKTTLEPVGDIHQWTRFNSNQMITNISIILLQWDSCGFIQMWYCCTHTKEGMSDPMVPDSLIARFWVTQLWSVSRRISLFCLFLWSLNREALILLCDQSWSQSRIAKCPGLLCWRDGVTVETNECPN